MRILGVMVLLAAFCAGAKETEPVTDGMRMMLRGSYAQAYPVLKEEAEAGSNRAARSLGWMRERGLKVRGGQEFAADPAEAIRWYALAGGRGDAESAKSLGVMYAIGLGAPLDVDKSLDWFAKGGENVEAMVKDYENRPAEDRREIAAWALATRVTYARESSKAEFYRNVTASGRLWLAFDAATRKASAQHVEVAGSIVDDAVALGDRVMALVPPTPAAKRLGAGYGTWINFGGY